jgi:nucleotide-binding universal stress UspA family protein
MLKSLLIGMDGSDDGRPVLELGLRWAKRFDALAVGIAVVDEPGILTSEAVLFTGGHHWHTTDTAAPRLSHSRHRAEETLEQFARRCGEAGVTWRTLEGVGSPYVQILMEAQYFDLILLGLETHFDYGHEGEPDETLSKVLRDSPRPVVAVPKAPGGDESVVVAYDGSLQASRTLYAFEASGLGRSQEIHVVSVAPDTRDAAVTANRAVGFLRLHGIEATSEPVGSPSPAAELILGKVRDFKAGLLVMGAYGQPALREFFLGSVTRSVLKATPVPVFCYH